MWVFNLLRLRAIKCFLFSIAFYFAIGINSPDFISNSKTSIFNKEYWTSSSLHSNAEGLLAEMEEGEEDFFYSNTISFAFNICFQSHIFHFYPIAFLFKSFRIQAHLLNIPPPIA